MDARYLNEYLKYVDKAKVFKSKLDNLVITYPELKSISDTPSVLPTNVPVQITADYLNTLFMYFYTTLYYLYAVGATALDTYCTELDLIESKTAELRNMINDTKALANKAISGCMDNKLTLHDNEPKALNIHTSLPIHNSYLKLESASTTYPTATENQYISGVRVENKSSLSYAFDGDPLSVWCDYIISYAPVNSTYEDYKSSGALLQMTLEFDTVIPIDRMVINPMSGYPMSLKRVIFYYGTQELKVDNSPKLDYLPDGRTTFVFPTVSADKVVLLFEQEHYIISDDIKKLRQITTNVDNPILSPVEPDYSKMKALIKAGLDQVVSLDVDFISKLGEFFELERYDSNPLVSASTEYIYVFGARSIEFYHTTYVPDCVVRTEKFDIDCNIYKLSIETDDSFSDGGIITYYVRLSDGVEIPIIPTNHNNVVRERLYFTNMTASTTFPVNGNLTVYKNDSQCNMFSSEVLSDSRVNIHLYDDVSPHKDIYFCMYSSDDNHTTIELSSYLDDPVFIEEEINNNVANTFKLENVPYISMEIINDTARFFRRDDNVAVYEYTSDAFYEVDGVTYGSYSTGYVYVSSDYTNLWCSGVLTPGNFPAASYITVGDYTWPVTVSSDAFITAVDLSEYLETGINYPYVVGSAITGPITTYEPLIIEIDGTPADNITSYESHDTNMFSTNGVRQITHSGKTVYMNMPADGSIIAKYYTKVSYLQVSAILSRHTAKDASDTPTIDTIKVSVSQRI